jgi:hypothetical protein
MVELVPVPVVVTVPGYLVNVHVPLPGSPFNITLPVDIAQLVCVIVPMIGEVGVVGCAGIIILADAIEVHPDKLVTLKLYVPAARPEMVALVPEPIIPPGLIVQLPLAGKPFKMTLPVDNVQVGGVMVPAVGAEGVMGCVLITTLADVVEMHPEALVMV